MPPVKQIRRDGPTKIDGNAALTVHGSVRTRTPAPLHHRAFMIPVRILGTSSLLAGRKVDTASLVAVAAADRDPQELLARTGIRSRHWVDAGETVTSLATRALRAALDDAGLEPAALRRVVLVSSTGADQLIPATVNGVLDELGVAGTCDGFDLNNACMGFLSGFDVAARTVATGRAPVAVVVVETLSRFLEPEVPRPYMVLGDATAAVVLGNGRPGEGIAGSMLANDGHHRGSVTLAHPGLTGGREPIRFADSNREMTSAAVAALVAAARGALAEAGLALDEIEWVVPHQPNGAMLDHLVQQLGVREERLVRVVHEIGSVGAASMGVGLDRLRRERTIRSGHRILMIGVGAGMAYGALVHRVG